MATIVHQSVISNPLKCMLIQFEISIQAELIRVVRTKIYKVSNR